MGLMNLTIIQEQPNTKCCVCHKDQARPDPHGMQTAVSHKHNLIDRDFSFLFSITGMKHKRSPMQLRSG